MCLKRKIECTDGFLQKLRRDVFRQTREIESKIRGVGWAGVVAGVVVARVVGGEVSAQGLVVVGVVGEVEAVVAPVEWCSVGGSAAARGSSSRLPRPSNSVSGTLGVGGRGGGGTCPYVIRTGDRAGQTCGRFHAAQCCFFRLDDAWREQFPDATELPRWADLLKKNIDIFALDFDAILGAMYAMTISVEGDCYLSVPPDPGIETSETTPPGGSAFAALGPGEAAALGASVSAALGPGEAAAPGPSASAPPGASMSALAGTASPEALHTFTLDSGASRCFFRDRTALEQLARPVAVSLADPSRGPVIATSSTVLPCSGVPSGTLSGLYLPSFSTNLVAGSALQDGGVHQFTPAYERVTHCTCARTGRHLATFTRQPGSDLYTLTTESPQVAASASTSGPLSTPYSCHSLSHQTVLWHHRLGHPSVQRLCGMHSRYLVSGLPRVLPPLPPSPAPPCLPCVEERQHAAPHSSSFPPTEAPLQTLHLDVWGPARVRGQGHERYFLLVVDDYTRYTTVFPLRTKGEVPGVLIPWIRATRLQLRDRFQSDFPVLRLHSDRGGEFSSDLLAAYCTEHGIRQNFTLPASPQQNGVNERCIGLVMEVARTSLIHAAAPHFLWPKAVQYAAHQLNLWPRVSAPETSPTLLWTGQVGDASRSRGPAPSGISQVDAVEPVEVAVDSGPERGTEPGGTETGGAEPGGAATGGVEPGGAPWGAGPWGTETGGAEPGGAEPRSSEPGDGDPTAPCFELHPTGATGDAAGDAGDSDAAGNAAGAVGGLGATGGAVGATGGTAGAVRGTGAARGATGTAGGTGGSGVGTPGGAPGAAGVGAAAGGSGAVSAGSGGMSRPQPYFVPLLQRVLAQPPPSLECPSHVQLQFPPTSPLPGPSPYTGPTGGLTERREPESRPVLPESRSASLVRAARPCRRVPRQQPPAVPGTHPMLLRLSTAPRRVPLPSPPVSSLPALTDPESDSLRAASPTVARLLSTVVTDPAFESAAASALVTELVDFAARCRLDFAASLVVESESVCPLSVEGECALGTDVLEDRQEEFECFAAAVPYLVSMLIAPEGDPDAPDIPTPRSYAEAIAGEYSSKWQTAMDAEMASWKSTSTYVDEGPPPGANIVSGMWIFRVKRPPGSPPVFKARLHKEIWLRRPPGFTGSFPPGTHGMWCFAALGFSPSTADLSLFLRTDTSLPPFYVLVYVDDLVFATADTDALAHVKSELQKRHTCTHLGELTSYLGLRITRDRARRTITLTQSHMVQQVLQRFGCTWSSAQATPLAIGHSLSALPSDESVEPSGPYPELVGCLMYLITCTRPDLAYPLGLQARYVDPGRHRKVHWDATKRVLRYLCSTSGMGLVLGGRRSLVLAGHSDASWVDDQATQRSLQGYTFSLGSGSVSWRSTRLSSVLSSSCEAEIYATAMATQELRWLTYLLTDLGERPSSPPVLYVDNKAAIALCQEHRLENRMKHIALRYFLARELQQRGQLCLRYVATRANTADIFTKALQPGDHQRFCTVLGLVPTVPHLLCQAKLGKLLMWDLEEKSSCIKDLWQLPIIPWNGKPPATAAAAATAKATTDGEETAPTDGSLDAVKKVQQTQQPHGEVLAGVDATAAWLKASSRSGEANWETWHERLCHVSFPMLQKLVKDGSLKGLEVKGAVKEIGSCPTCLETKFTKFPFSSGTGPAKAPLALVHMDVVGPTRAPSLSGSHYFLTIVDDHTRAVWVYPLRTKGEVAVAVLKEWMPRAQRESRHKVKVIRTDNGGEFIGAHFEAVLKKKGIQHQLTVPYNPQQNGVAEHFNRTLQEGARTLLGRAGLPDPFCVTALRQVALVKNRVLATVGDKQWVPYTKWYGSAPAVNMLRAYGCMVVFHVHKEKRGKLEASGRWEHTLGLLRIIRAG
ncbi:unnamed protein product [Closterium sp. NIES-54]